MTTSHLAVLGGPPAFPNPLHVGRPNLPNRSGFERRLRDALDRAWLTNDGPLVRELEERVGDALGVGHCVAVANATLGIELLLRTLAPEGEVILPSFTFIATAHAVRTAGLRPVFCDIDPATHNIDPRCAARLITQRTRAILGVHVWGEACDVAALEQLADSAGVRLFFDAAHAFGCSLADGRKIGRFGSAEVFSLHATKFVHSFEGGLVTTQDDELARSLRLQRNFGFTGYDRVEALGTNAKLSEAHAAMGLANLERMDVVVSHNRTIHTIYAEGLAKTGVRLRALSPGSNYQYVVCEVLPDLPLSREELVAGLHAENILARRYFYPGCHRSDPYRLELQPELRHTEALSNRCLILPTGLATSGDAAAAVCQIVQALLERADEVRAVVASRPSA